MTNQMVISDRSVNASNTTAARGFQSANSTSLNYQSRLLESMKAQYQLDQQVKFLHLRAEAETLLQQLKVMKQQREAVSDQQSGDTNDTN